MLDVLCPLITESDNVSQELLDIILINIVEPNKSARKNSYHLAKELITKTHETLEQYVQQVSATRLAAAPHFCDYGILIVPRWNHFYLQFFNQALVMDKVNKNCQISSKIYDLIYELNVICPSILLSVLPQLECKLKAGLESERLSTFASIHFCSHLIWFFPRPLIFLVPSCRGCVTVGTYVFGKGIEFG